MNCTSYGCRPNGEKIGILLAALGTPEAPTAKALRLYLKQFLSDRRVIEKNKIFWWFLLNGIILRRRPKKSAALYKRVWTDEGSPLLITTRNQSQKLETLLRDQGHEVHVDFGMRYGNPSLESAIDALVAKGCRKILLFPMYPQYAAATTASTYDAVFPALRAYRYVPSLKVVDPYFRHPAYISAQAQVINEHLTTIDEPDALLLSYHGIPKEYVDKGDPYCCQCTATTVLLKQSIALDATKVHQGYQSRFGKDPWIQPYSDELIEGYGKSGIKHLSIACPGFTADCLETIDEMGTEAEELFHECGGEQLSLIPCLNEHTAWIEAMGQIATETLGSWLQQEAPCAIACPSQRIGVG